MILDQIHSIMCIVYSLIPPPSSNRFCFRSETESRSVATGGRICDVSTARQRRAGTSTNRAENSDYRQPSLLRARRERPRRRAAEERDRLATVDARDHSITSLAMARSCGGTFMPSVRAVCKLITKSNLVGRITGKSAGLSPLRMRPV